MAHWRWQQNQPQPVNRVFPLTRFNVVFDRLEIVPQGESQKCDDKVTSYRFELTVLTYVPLFHHDLVTKFISASAKLRITRIDTIQ